MERFGPEELNMKRGMASFCKMFLSRFFFYLMRSYNAFLTHRKDSSVLSIDHLSLLLSAPMKALKICILAFLLKGDSKDCLHGSPFF